MFLQDQNPWVIVGFQVPALPSAPSTHCSRLQPRLEEKYSQNSLSGQGFQLVAGHPWWKCVPIFPSPLWTGRSTAPKHSPRRKVHCNTGILSQKINPTDLPAVLMDYLGINIPARTTDFIVIILFIILSLFTILLWFYWDGAQWWLYLGRLFAEGKTHFSPNKAFIILIIYDFHCNFLL